MHRNASLNSRFFKLGSISDTETTVNQEEAPFSEASSIIRSIFGGAKSMIDLAIIHLNRDGFSYFRSGGGGGG